MTRKPNPSDGCIEPVGAAGMTCGRPAALGELRCMEHHAPLAGPSSTRRAESGVRELLRFIGENPDRDGLKDTPGRVVRAFEQMTAGYHEDPREILSRCFDVSYDAMVVLDDIPFTSLCEHHLLAFTGTARVGYVPRPGGKVVGISKLARVVACFARRLQVQERMTVQIADAIAESLGPLGVGVVLKARHSCMSCRGPRVSAVMTTSVLYGVMRDEPATRAEFMGL